MTLHLPLLRIVLCATFLVSIQSLCAQTHTARTVNIPGANCGGYYEYLPVNYNTNTTTKYALLIYIHGNGAYGNGSASAMNIVLQEGVPRVINQGNFPTTFTVNGQTTSFIVISPQFFSAASPAQANAFIDYILSRPLRIDLNRVYLTGFSVGGGVAVRTPRNLGAASRLAALMPISHYNNPYNDSTAQFIAAANLPSWFIHSNSDGVPVSNSQNYVNKINSFNPITPAIITRPNNITHDNSHIVFYDPNYRPSGRSLYEWCLQYSRNHAPIANAGNDQTITYPDTDVNLSSAGSSDPENTALTYSWSKVSGPSQFNFNNTAAANPVVSNLLAGIYNFQLQVTDANGLSDLDTVKVTVVNPNPNQLPVADAGNHATIYLPQNSVALGGNGSFDPDGIIETYNWSYISGPNQYTISSPSSVNTNVSNLKVGTYRFKLAVTDNQGAGGSDTVEITVINPFPNILPVARAGNDQDITLPVTTTALSGSASSDADGVILFYEWRQVAGPANASFSAASAVNTNVTNMSSAGIYQFELKVTDDSSATDLDTVQVTVNAVPPPSQNVVKVNIYGGSFPAGTGWNNWNVQSNLNLNSTTNENGTTSPVTANLSISNAIADNGASYPVTMCPQPVGRTTSYTTVTRTLIISGLNNTKRYNLEVYGSRTGTTANSTRYIVGSTTLTINVGNNYANKATFSNLAPSAGQIRLTMERTNGSYNYINGFVISEVVEGGGGGPNQPPIAVPGNNQSITLPTSQVTLSASGSSDTDGTINLFNWQKISGPAATITTPNSSNTTVIGLTAGVYLFQLTVTDDDGATATGNVEVTVNEPYIPPTGADSINCGKVFKIVVLGSSTAVGTGSNPIDSSWVYKFRAYVRGKNIQSQVISLAASGFTTYHTLNPTGYTPPAGRPAPDTARNITKALQQNPDLIIINLPSNDNVGNYPLQEQKDNYERTMALANARGIPVFVSTTQPRNNLTSAQMTNQIAMREWTYQRFGEKAMDFWTGIANADGTINPLYNADGVHLKNGGHHILYTRVVAERVLDTLCLRKNIKPIANAGNNTTIFLPADSIQLSSTGSSDPDGSIAAFNWSKIEGPAAGVFSNANIANPKLRNLAFGVYKIELKVTDNLGAIARDTVTITVNTVDPMPPVANAGAPISTTLPADSVLLSGTASSDPDGSITGYKWTKISGPDEYGFEDSTLVNARVRDLVVGTYIFELMVTDNSGMTGKDSVTVTVLPVPNQLPVAKAGTNIVIDYPGTSTPLDGSLSADNDGNIVSYRWRKISGPASFAIDDSTVVNPVISELAPGTYVIELKVTDNENAIDRDSVTVVVGSPPNQLPVADAGDDSFIVLPGTLQLNGNGSDDPDGTINSYHWLKVSGPASFNINNANIINPTISNLSPGIYVVQLTVTDNSTGTDRDSITITVYPPLNTLPVARAGNDQTITLPANSVTLSGSTSSDNNGAIISYQWTQVAGPSAAVLSAPGAMNTNAGSLVEGLYRFELTVTDDSSTVDTDTVAITVNPAPTIIQKFVQVNVYGGSFPAGTGWNNWNVQSNLNLNSTAYSDGTASPVTANLNMSNAIADNGATYPVTMCPQVVGRTTSYSTVPRWLILSGLADNKRYDLEVYASRTGSGNSTRFIVGSSQVVVNTGNNYTTKAVFTNIVPVSGQIRLDIQRVNTYNYINGFILTEITNTATRTTGQQWVSNEPLLPVQQSTDLINEEKTAVPAVGVYPNPARDQVELQLNNKETGSLQVSLVDQHGKMLKELRLVKQAGLFRQTISLGDISPGVYFIRMQMAGWQKVEKVIKIQ
jgi:lysophospholipase L1-like esterase/dienelactone hydrolase